MLSLFFTYLDSCYKHIKEKVSECFTTVVDALL